MSENLDLVRAICADWAHGDFSSAEWANPDIEFVVADGMAPGVWNGLAGMAESWRETLSAWEDLRVHVEELRELDEGRVLVLLNSTGRGRNSRFDLRDLSWAGANLFHVRDGKVTRLVIYWDRERALADLGLEQ